MEAPDYFRFFRLGVLHVHENVHCVHDFFQRAPLGNPVLLASAGNFLGPENSPAPFPGGVSDAEPDFFAALRSARRVCAVLKI